MCLFASPNKGGMGDISDARQSLQKVELNFEVLYCENTHGIVHLSGRRIPSGAFPLLLLLSESSTHAHQFPSRIEPV